MAALDHLGLADLDPTPWSEETPERKAARLDAWIASRVPDVRLLLDRLLGATPPDFLAGSGAAVDPARVAVVGHSFGGWTALAAPDVEPRLRAVVALAPAGSSNPKPGVIPATLSFAWGRDVPTLYLVAENDTPLPLAGMYELFERTPASRWLVILRRADHSHFVDLAEEEHEAMRALPATGESGWIPGQMLPFAELCPADEAHRFVRGLTLAHLDATLRGRDEARRLLDGDFEAGLAGRGVAAAPRYS